MKMVSFDFHTIANVDEFYRQFVVKFAIEMQFGANLDALWDALTGMIDLPARITLRHLAEHKDAAQFDAIIAVMREAEEETAGNFSLRLR
ncbi:barstar family protein [Pantoea sp. BAV 3049]|uniref:barstar family protein n=1 Tax=Pantoea sp. BAV 3049 TaxID=2654188 RepID=UPI00131B152E|nr:barstar family protein [Pantoea sp. BAV 3049]